MTTTPGELPTDLETCHQLIRELLESLSRQSYLNEKLQHQLEQLLRRIYGRKSEKLNPNQLLLFAQEILAASKTLPLSATPQADTAPASTEPIPPKKNGHGRKPLPPGLTRKPVLHDVAPEILPCPDCGTVRIRFGEETSEQLEFVRASLIVLQHVRPKYACKTCEGNIVIGLIVYPSRFRERDCPGRGSWLSITVGKYVDHLPLYRQGRMFLRDGVELSRQTMCDWMAVSAELDGTDLEGHVPADSAIAGDPDRRHPGAGAKPDHRSHDDGPALDLTWATTIIPFLGVYDYTPDRSGDGPERMLADFRTGYLQSDAYSVYDRIHARAHRGSGLYGPRAAKIRRGEKHRRRTISWGHWPGSDGSTRSSVPCDQGADRKNDRGVGPIQVQWMPRSGGSSAKEEIT